jgi:CubicO group peptidase (beta-lactamase class C family)
MKDTAFWCPPEKLPRLAALYDGDPATGKLIPAVEGAWRDVSKPPAAPSGGGGLVSTAGDFARFAQMILNGGELDGVRVLKPETVALMRPEPSAAGFQVTTNGTAGVLRRFPTRSRSRSGAPAWATAWTWPWRSTPRGPVGRAGRARARSAGAAAPAPGSGSTRPTTCSSSA